MSVEELPRDVLLGQQVIEGNLYGNSPVVAGPGILLLESGQNIAHLGHFHEMFSLLTALNDDHSTILAQLMLPPLLLDLGLPLLLRGEQTGYGSGLLALAVGRVLGRLGETDGHVLVLGETALLALQRLAVREEFLLVAVSSAQVQLQLTHQIPRRGVVLPVFLLRRFGLRIPPQRHPRLAGGQRLPVRRFLLGFRLRL